MAGMSPVADLYDRIFCGVRSGQSAPAWVWCRGRRTSGGGSMLLTRACRYGILAMASLVKDREPGERHLAREIASAYNIPPEYLAKIMTQLVKAGLVESLRGPSGGYLLTRKPSGISIGQVITAIDGDVTDLGDSRSLPPKVRKVLQERMKRVQKLFEETTLADLV